MTTPEYLTKYLDPKKHIVQIWSGIKDANIGNIVEKGFKTVFSTYDTLYLDCGYGNWLVEVTNVDLSPGASRNHNLSSNRPFLG